MKKLNLLLFIPGIILCSCVPVINRITTLPDLGMGLIMGLGIGLLTLSLIIKNGNKATWRA